jgi:hypothetical protein
MKIKDLPTAASFTFEGACATDSSVNSKNLDGKDIRILA